MNTRALTSSRINRDTADPPAGRIVKDPVTGEPTGMLHNAYSVLKDVPGDAYGDDDNAADNERVKQLFRLYNVRGITSIADRSASIAALHLYRRLRDRGELTVRVNATRVLSPPFGNREAVVAKLNGLAGYQVPGEPNGPTGVGDHMIRMDPLLSTNPWDPWLGIWVAVTRKTEGGVVLNPDQRLSRIESLGLYTINNARLHGEGADKGTIEPGKLADLIAVDRNPLTCPEDDLKSTRVLWSMVGGTTVLQE